MNHACTFVGNGIHFLIIWIFEIAAFQTRFVIPIITKPIFPKNDRSASNK